MNDNSGVLLVYGQLSSEFGGSGLEVCPTMRTDPPRAHATRRSTDGFIIVYLRHPSSYGCSDYRIEIFKYALCGSGGQKVRTR
jgi:hypothetical protein